MSQDHRSEGELAEQVVTTGDIIGWQWVRKKEEAQRAETLPATAAALPLPEPVPHAQRYEPRSVLGKGGMGEVKLCKDVVVGREVALKSLLPGLVADDGIRTRFLREAQIQGQLEHPAIVPVYDLSRDADGTPFFTMKRLRGRTLEDILKGLRQGRPEDLAAYPRYRLLRTLAAVCQAVDFAHCRGVLHRDLKPANIMMGDFGEVYVIDWGLAKVKGSSEPMSSPMSSPVQPTADIGATAVGTVTGTLAYMSPEQARAQGDAIDVRSDVFTLGVILFELLTLQRLRPAGTPERVLLAIYEEQPERPSARAQDRDIAPELDEICVRATQKDPAARYATVRELHGALDRYLAGERSLVLRQQLAAEHTTAAAAAAERALAGEDDAAPARLQALSAIGQAVALDPNNSRALSILHRLLTEPPVKLPAEVESQVQEIMATHERHSLGSLMLTGGALFFLIPILLAMGVRDWRLMALLLGFGAVSLTLRFWVSRPGVMLKWRYVAQLASLALYFCMGRIFGPLVLPGVAILTHTVLNSLTAHAGPRRFAVASSCGLLIVMVLLEQLGVLAPSYSFVGGAMVIAPNLVTLSPGLTEILLLGMSVITLAVAGLSIGRLPPQQLVAERQKALHAWQMSHLLPKS